MTETPKQNIKQSNQAEEMMMMGGGHYFQQILGVSFFCNTVNQLVPEAARSYVNRRWDRVYDYFYPYVHMNIPEYTRSGSNEAYTAVRHYLGDIAKSCNNATHLTGEKPSNAKSLAITPSEGQVIVDRFCGASFSWRFCVEKIKSKSGRGPKDKNSYDLTFHEKHRDLVTQTYLDTVIEKGKAIEIRNRKRKLYSNKRNEGGWYWNYEPKWNHINFHHPASFGTLAMDPKKKQEIISDLDAFRKGKDYYAKVGKAWKRGYLLHGPPGTGKSTMIAAIANYMDYDIYDLELTSIESNTDLKELLIETKSKSIIVIEDIDCSADLTKKRTEAPKKKKKGDDDNEDEYKDDDDDEEEAMDKKKKEASKVTLSGLLNFIDGIWSACGEERIIIFTTNHVNKLDPALIRRGRMDMHIEMSYCKFEAFKILAKNYLNIDSHPLFDDIKPLLDNNKVSPCDVAENLMPKSDPPDVDGCLTTLIEAIKAAAAKEAAKELAKEAAAKVGKDACKSKKSFFMRKIDFLKRSTNSQNLMCGLIS